MSSPKRRKSHSPITSSSTPPSLRSRTLKSKRTIFHLEVTSPKNAIKEKEKEKEREREKDKAPNEKKKHHQLITTRSSPRKDRVKNSTKPNQIQPPSPDLLRDDILKFSKPSQNKTSECDQVEDEILSGVSDTKEEEDCSNGKIEDSPLDWTPRLRNDKIVVNLNSRESSQDSEKDLVFHFESNIGMNLNSPPSSAPTSRSPSFLSKLIPPPKNTQSHSPYRPPLNTLTRTISPPIKRIKQETISPEKIIGESVVISSDLSLSLSCETKLSRSDTVCIIDGSSSLPKIDHNITTPNAVPQNVTTVQGIEIEADVNKISIFQLDRDDDSLANESSEYSIGGNSNSNLNSGNNTHNNTNNDSNHINSNGQNPDPRLKLEFTEIPNERNDVNSKPENCTTNLVKELENTIFQLNDKISELKSQNNEYQQTIATQNENFEKSVVDFQSRISVLTSQRSQLEDKVGKTMEKMGHELLKTEKVEREANILFKLLRTEVERAKRLEMQVQLLEKSYTNDNNNNINNNNTNIFNNNNNNISCTPENEELEVLKDRVFMMEMQLAKSNMLWKKTTR